MLQQEIIYDMTKAKIVTTVKKNGKIILQLIY